MKTPYRLLLSTLLVVGWVHPIAAQDSIPDATLVSGRLGFSGYATPGPWSAWTETMSGAMTGGGALTEVRGWVEFPAASLDSDNGRRDKDMRKSLETDEYPTIRFDLNAVSELRSYGDSSTVTLHGIFHIHGVDREVEAPATVHRTTEGHIRLTADIPLNLKDYDIGGLSKALGMLKMNPEITVHVDVTFGGS